MCAENATKILPYNIFNQSAKIFGINWEKILDGRQYSVVHGFEYGYFENITARRIKTSRAVWAKRALYIKKFADSDLFSKVWGFEDHHLKKNTPLTIW